MKFKLEVSARHIHLSEDDRKTLFGDQILTKRNNLSQKGEFATNQTIEVVGPEGRITKVRVLGPIRENSQLELSKTDCYNIGINAPLALSGSGKGASVKVIGPKGSVIKNIAIIPLRHIHLSEPSAKKYGLTDKSSLCIVITGDRSTVFCNTKVRIGSSYNDAVHIDTDEANASGASSGMIVIAKKE